MPLALETPQLILMALSFAAMLASIGVAAWLWQRQRAPARPTDPTPASARSTSERTPASAPESAPLVDEPTEFVALPHLREADAPRSEQSGTEVIAAFHEAAPERTFVAPAEPTRVVAPPAEPTQLFAPERTEFIPAPFASLTTGFEGGHSAGLPHEGQSPSRGPLPSDPVLPPTPTLIDLPEHLRLALDAFEQLQVHTPTPALAGHLDVLGSAPADTLLELVRPTLASADGHRFAGALLTLLHNKTWPAKSAFASLLAELDQARKHTALSLLRSWDDPRGEAIAAAALANATDLENRLMWLSCFAERGWDPGVATIEAALADPDPRIVTVGLRLLPRSDAAPRLQTKLAGSLFAGEPSVRIQAIEAALAFGNQSAWLVCRQLARNPGFPGAAQLVGLLGTDAEIAEQCRAFEATPTPELLAGLALSGRPVVLRACVERFDDPDEKLREAARAALTLAAGEAFESVTEARTWVMSQQHRALGGGQRSAASVIAVLGEASEPTRRVLARELRIRSRGRLHVDPSLLPHAFVRQLEQLQPRLSEIDFERGFPWG